MQKSQVWAQFASEIIPLRADTKRPAMRGWSTWQGSVDWLKQWEREGKGYGMLARRHPGIDIDVTLPGLVSIIRQHALKTFGPAPVRTRPNSSKCLLMYCTDETLRKRRFVFTAQNGSEHAVELLATGQQYVVEGTHPEGGEYAWDRDAHKLTPITGEQWDTFCTSLAELLQRAAGCTVTKDGLGAKSSQGNAARCGEGLLAPDPQVDPVLAMRHWAERWRTNDMHVLPHDAFIDLCAAFRGAAGDHADSLFDDFRECLPAPRDTEEGTEYRFHSFDSGVRLGWSRLCQITGYAEPDVFDDMPTAQVEAMATPDPIKVEKQAKFAPIRRALFKATAPRLHEFVEGVFNDGVVSVLYGPSNIGKSFAALDMGLHVALGWNWHGRGVERGEVVYIAGEGVAGLRQRLDAFDKHYGEDKTADALFSVVRCMPNFRDHRDIDALADMLRNPRLTIVDTVLRALQGGDENSSTDMGLLYNNAQRLAEKTKSHVLLIHHSGKDASKGARGHSGLLGNIDTELRAVRDDENGPITLTMPKQRDGERADVLTYRLLPVELGTNQWGKKYGSCVVEQTQKARDSRLKDDAQAAVSMLEAIILEQKKVSMEVWRQGCYERWRASGFANENTLRSKFNRAVKELEAAGLIRVTTGGVYLKKEEAD